MWILPHFKIPYSNTWIWCWSLKCRVLINRHKFRAWTQNLWWILRILHSGFTLHTQDSPIQIHWVLSVECWVSVISLGPGSCSQGSKCENSLQRSSDLEMWPLTLKIYRLLPLSIWSIHTKFKQPRLYSSCYILPTRIQVPEFFVKAQWPWNLTLKINRLLPLSI